MKQTVKNQKKVGGGGGVGSLLESEKKERKEDELHFFLFPLCYSLIWFCLAEEKKEKAQQVGAAKNQ
jgi:hypothetical protein